MARLCQLMNTKVDWANIEHERLFRRMWSLYRPLLPYPGPKHELYG